MSQVCINTTPSLRVIISTYIRTNPDGTIVTRVTKYASAEHRKLGAYYKRYECISNRKESRFVKCKLEVGSDIK